MHKWNTFDSKSTRFHPYFGSNNYRKHKLVKVGIKSCRFAIEYVSFVHAWMCLATQLEFCLHEQAQIVASVAYIVGSQQFHSQIASLLLVSLLFIAIPTSFLNFYLFLVRLLFIVQWDLNYLHWNLKLSVYTILLYISMPIFATEVLHFCTVA